MSVRILVGDCRQTLATLPDGSVQTCVTSPPYFGLRDYGTATWEGGDVACDHKTGKSARNDGARIGVDGAVACAKCGARRVDSQIGLEQTPDAYVAELVAVFREVRRVLRDDGTLWLNLGDSYANNGTGGNGATGGRDKSTLQSPMPPVGTTPVQKSVPPGLKVKDLIGIPWRVALALQADGWYLRSDIIWAKPNAMPESVKDRPTRAHEYLFLLTKQERYFYDAAAIAEDAVTADPRTVDGFVPKSVNGKHADDESGQSAKVRASDKQRGHSRRHAGFNDRWDAAERSGQNTEGKRNKRSVWTVSPAQFSGAHFATFPPALIEPCILAGSKRGDTVLDPFGGAGTTGLVADRFGRDAILCELNPGYAAMAEDRITAEQPLLADVKME